MEREADDELAEDAAPVPETDDTDDTSTDAASVDADADAGEDEAYDDDAHDDRWAIEENDGWPGMPLAPADAAAIAPPDRAPRLADPGAWARRLVLIQVLLVAVGSAPWWALLYFDADWEAAELAWFLAAAFGAGLALYGHRHRLGWVTAFGYVSSGLVLLLQMRGAGLLFGFGLSVFTGLLAGALVLSLLLAMLAVREIGLVT